MINIVYSCTLENRGTEIAKHTRGELFKVNSEKARLKLRHNVRMLNEVRIRGIRKELSVAGEEK